MGVLPKMLMTSSGIDPTNQAICLICGGYNDVRIVSRLTAGDGTTSVSVRQHWICVECIEAFGELKEE